MKITDLELFYLAAALAVFEDLHRRGHLRLGRTHCGGSCTHRGRRCGRIPPGADRCRPCKIEHLVQLMYRGTYYRGGPVFMSAISGIEQALWDIKGKYYHMPIYEMLGGACRDRVQMYGHLKPAAIAGDFPVEEMLKIADQRLAEGFYCRKIFGHPAHPAAG